MNSFSLRLAAAVLCCTAMMAAQNLPPGTALPVEVGTTLNARNARPGQKIEGKLMQELQLPSNAIIKKGARVIGQVVSVQKPSRITVQFKQLQDGNQTIPLNVSVRALAATESVFQAGLPVGSSTSLSSNEWVTQQVGGEFVFRGRGYVGDAKVARWDGSGVWGKLSPGGNCLDDNGAVQSLWIFSTSACGPYGFDIMEIVNNGSSDPMGQITLKSAKPVLVRGGSGWLLLVNSTPTTGGSNNP